MSKGNVFISSKGTETSKANQELVPTKPKGNTYGYTIKKISFDNVEACTLKVNGVEMSIKAGQGFELGYDDPDASSFVVVEPSIQFLYIATI